MNPMQADNAAKVREVTPEQYAQGFVVWGGHRVAFNLIRRLENGNYLVREPKANF